MAKPKQTDEEILATKLAKKSAKKGMSLSDRLKSSNTLEHTFYMGDEENPYEIKDWFDTGNILFNCLLSADPYKGSPSGRTVQLAGPSSVGKTLLCLELLKSTQKKGYFGVLYDSEFANAEKQDLIKRGVDPNLLIWKGVDKVEDLTTDIINVMEDMEPTDRLAMMIDSIGNLSTRKEITDSASGSDKKDMTRAAQLKALFRTCTLKAGVLNIPIFLVNHVYANVSSFIPSNSIGGGCLTAGHNVKTSNGLIDISKITVGDSVETMFGFRDVLEIFEFEKETITFNFEDNSTITCSKEHRFLTQNGDKLEWKHAYCLEEGDEIIKY